MLVTCDLKLMFLINVLFFNDQNCPLNILNITTTTTICDFNEIKQFLWSIRNWFIKSLPHSKNGEKERKEKFHPQIWTKWGLSSLKIKPAFKHIQSSKLIPAHFWELMIFKIRTMHFNNFSILFNDLIPKWENFRKVKFPFYDFLYTKGSNLYCYIKNHWIYYIISIGGLLTFWILESV